MSANDRTEADRLKAGLRIAGIGLWERDLRTNKVTRTAIVDEIFGFKPGETGDEAGPFLARIHPDDRAAMERQVAAAAESGLPINTEFRIARPDGAVRWIWGQAEIQKSADGRPLRLVSVLRDITDRKQMELAIRESETRFRQLADTAPVLIWMSGSDKAGVYFNKPWLDFTGRALDRELGDGWLDSIHPDDFGALEACGDAFASRRPFRTEFRLRRHDGAWRWMLDTGVPRFTEDGRFAGYIGSCVDITDRRDAEIAMRQSEERLREAQEIAGLGRWEFDVDSGRITWSDEVFRIFDRDKALGEPTLDELIELLHPEDRPQFTGLIRRALDEGQDFVTEWRVRRADGSYRWKRTWARVHTEGGRVTRLVGSDLDITERKQTEERMKLLAHEVDHRAKNMLAVVQAMLRLTRAESMPDFIASLEGRVHALARAHTLLSESRWQGAELKRLVEEELAPYRIDGGARVRADGPAVSLQPACAQALAMALHELATNAAKYGALSTAAGRVDLTWSRSGDGNLVLCWVESGGPPTRTPGRRGLGMMVIERTAKDQLGGHARFEWRSDGLICEIGVPSEQLAHRPAA